jgi:hypothetical protein
MKKNLVKKSRPTVRLKAATCPQLPAVILDLMGGGEWSSPWNLLLWIATYKAIKKWAFMHAHRLACMLI